MVQKQLLVKKNKGEDMELDIHDTGNNKEFMIKLDEFIFTGENIKGYELKRNVDGANELIIRFKVIPKNIDIKNSILKTEFLDNCL